MLLLTLNLDVMSCSTWANSRYVIVNAFTIKPRPACYLLMAMLHKNKPLEFQLTMNKTYNTLPHWQFPHPSKHVVIMDDISYRQSYLVNIVSWNGAFDDSTLKWWTKMFKVLEWNAPPPPVALFQSLRSKWLTYKIKDTLLCYFTSEWKWWCDFVDVEACGSEL